PRSTLFPYTTLFRSHELFRAADMATGHHRSYRGRAFLERLLLRRHGELEPADDLESPRELALQMGREGAELQRDRARLIHLGSPWIEGFRCGTRDSGVGRNRTGIDGFAGRCMTILPPRHPNQEAPQGAPWGASLARSRKRRASAAHSRDPRGILNAPSD